MEQTNNQTNELPKPAPTVKLCHISFNLSEEIDGFEIHLRGGRMLSWDKWSDQGKDVRIRTFKEDITVEVLYANETQRFVFPMEVVDFYKKRDFRDNTGMY